MPLAAPPPPRPHTFRSRFYWGLATVLAWWASLAFGLFPLGWLVTAFFFHTLKGLPAKGRFRWGYAIGVASFALINWWLILTITRAAPAIGASAPVGFFLGLLSVGIIAFVFGLCPAVCAAVWRETTWWRMLAAAAVWVGFDWLRAQGPIGNTWGILGYSQVLDLLLLKLLPNHLWLSAFCVGVGGLMAWSSPRYRTLPLYLAGLGICVAHGVALIFPSQVDSARAGKVLIVQTTAATIGQRGSMGVTSFVQAYRLTKDALAKGFTPDLIVWPETTVEFTGSAKAGYKGLDWVILSTQGFPTHILTGALVTGPDGQRRNEAVLISPNGQVSSYAKRRVVPFGERAPFTRYFPWLARFAPEPALEPGTNNLPLAFRSHGTGFLLYPMICFESCFAGNDWAPSGLKSKPQSSLNVVITNDQWFAGSEAPNQHRAMSIMRAVETGRTLIQSANGGPTFVAHPSGQVTAELPFGQAGTIEVDFAQGTAKSRATE